MTNSNLDGMSLEELQRENDMLVAQILNQAKNCNLEIQEINDNLRKALR